MQWNGAHIEKFEAAKQYIDTAIIPLIVLTNEQPLLKESAIATNFIEALAQFTEKQLAGRVMLLPSMLLSEKMDLFLNIQQIYDVLKENGFTYIFFLTAYSPLKTFENILWYPAIPLESMEASTQKAVLENQFARLVEQLTSVWNDMDIDLKK